jgi:sortase A
VAFTLLVACGLAFVLYPQAKAWSAEQELQKIAYGITDEVKASSSRSTADKIIEAANVYNQNLVVAPGRAINPESYLNDAEYRNQLQFGMQSVSTVYIPKTDTKVPVYLGTGPWELAHGAGHLYGSSLPVGGSDTHTVITAHAGVPGIELFTRLFELEIGDQFTITTSNLRMTYQVKEIQTVLPDEVDALGIVAGEDLATLVTCTPININSHRLLVTGERVAQPLLPISAAESDFPWWAVIFACGTVAAAILGFLLFRQPKPAGHSAGLEGIAESQVVSTAALGAAQPPMVPSAGLAGIAESPHGRHLRLAEGGAV